MSPDGGYTRLYRRLWNNPAFRSKQEAAVFAWMVSTAQWRDSRLATRFGPIDLKVGELLIAERELSEDFGFHRNTLRALLQRMVDEGIIQRFLDRSPHRAGTVVRIVNYVAYQQVEPRLGNGQDRNGTGEQTETGPQEDRIGTKNKEGNKGKEEKQGTLLSCKAEDKPDDPMEGFDEFWAVYPLKKAKQEAQKAWPKAVKTADGGWRRIVAGAVAYAAEIRARGQTHIKFAQGWLNGHRWNDHPFPEPIGDPAQVVHLAERRPAPQPRPSKIEWLIDDLKQAGGSQ